MSTQSGIYEIKNTLNGHRYIGSAVDFSRRWANHRLQLNAGVHHSRVLQRAWDKHGASTFEFRVMLSCPKDQLLFQEQRCLHGFMPEYNVCKVAGSSLGVKRTAATRARVSVARRLAGGRPEVIEHMAAAQRGKKHSAAHRAKISASLVGNKHTLGYTPSDAVRAKMSVVHRGNTHAFGYRFTPEARLQMSDSRRGVSKTAEHCARIGAALRAYHARKQGGS